MGARSVVCPEASWATGSASANCSAKREFVSVRRRSSQAVARGGAAVPRTRIAAGIAGSTARIASVPSTASSAAVSSPSGAVIAASCSEVSSPDVSGPAVIGTITPTGETGVDGSGTIMTLVAVRVPEGPEKTALRGYTPGEREEIAGSSAGTMTSLAAVAPEATASRRADPIVVIPAACPFPASQALSALRAVSAWPPTASVTAVSPTE